MPGLGWVENGPGRARADRVGAGRVYRISYHDTQNFLGQGPSITALAPTKKEGRNVSLEAGSSGEPWLDSISAGKGLVIAAPSFFGGGKWGVELRARPGGSNG